MPPRASACRNCEDADPTAQPRGEAEEGPSRDLKQIEALVDDLEAIVEHWCMNNLLPSSTGFLDCAPRRLRPPRRFARNDRGERFFNRLLGAGEAQRAAPIIRPDSQPASIPTKANRGHRFPDARSALLIPYSELLSLSALELGLTVSPSRSHPRHHR